MPIEYCHDCSQSKGLPMAGKQCDRYIRAQQLLYFSIKKTMRLLIFYVVLEVNPILQLLSYIKYCIIVLVLYFLNIPLFNYIVEIFNLL